MQKYLISSELHEDLLKTTLLDTLHFFKFAWDKGSKQTIENCFCHCEFKITENAQQYIPQINMNNDEYIELMDWSDKLPNGLTFEVYASVDDIVITKVSN